MLAKSLILGFLVTVVVAKIPPYIKVCGRRNPNLDQCILKSVEGLREKLRTGMPELNVPPLEPMILKGFPLSETETFRAYAENVKLTGLTNFEVKSFHNDLDKNQLNMHVVFKRIDLDADYDINAKILVPIKGKGPIHIVSHDVEAKVVMQYKFAMKNGAKYVYFSSMTTKLSIKDFEADFKSADGVDSPITKAINDALDGGRKEILELVRPTLEKVISEKILELGNNVCKGFTYDELHPDTTE
ncbi:putative beta-carotene-binding protein [Venturia canescens]|uniref:putative beta-carotene-binding protein n=1 Tax=Venturia canescens TaxID=32260 RepID=UPI001C9D24EB|nr:putative beta-carotene-binding protein [Venturia canescens]